MDCKNREPEHMSKEEIIELLCEILGDDWSRFFSLEFAEDNA